MDATSEDATEMVDVRCGGEGCVNGSVNWRTFPQSPDDHAGVCGACGTTNILCECGESNVAVTDEVSCESCENRWRVAYDADDDELVRVTRL